MALGISVYPERADIDAIVDYVQTASSLGFTRVFSCLLSARGDRAQVVRRFQPVARAIHGASMALTLDVSPAVFSALGLPPDDLSFFAELGADAIRLDEAFTPREVAALTFNAFGLAIELNGSTADGTVAAVCGCHPDHSRLSVCHNFYPQRHTGLDDAFFERECQTARGCGLSVAAFASAADRAALGPWPVEDGLPTLEGHRDLPIDLQARHLFATGLVDDVVVSNFRATDDELRSLAALDPSLVQISVEPARDVDDRLLSDVCARPRRVRGDSSAYLLRDSDTRATLGATPIAARNTRDLVPGDVAVVNDGGGRYRGELQLALRPMANDGTKNVVASVAPAERFLMDYLGPWSGFQLFVR